MQNDNFWQPQTQVTFSTSRTCFTCTKGSSESHFIEHLLGRFDKCAWTNLYSSSWYRAPPAVSNIIKRVHDVEGGCVFFLFFFPGYFLQNMVCYHPRLKMYIHWGTGPKQSIYFGAFRSRLHPPPCLIHFEFLVTPPYFIHFQPFIWNEGGLTFIHYVWWGLKESPESCSTK